MMKIKICTTRPKSARPIGLDRGAKILFKWVHFGVFSVSLRASSAELGGAPTDLLWSKKYDVTHGWPQLTSFDAKNVTSLMAGLN